MPDTNSHNTPTPGPNFDRLFPKAERYIQKKIQTLERKITFLEEKLQYCLTWEHTQLKAQLLLTNIANIKKGMKEITVEDWSNDSPLIITLDPRLSPSDNIAAIFKEARKQKKGIPHTEKLLEREKIELTAIMHLLSELQTQKTEEELTEFCKQRSIPLDTRQAPPKQKSEAPPLPYKKYISPTGFSILVGKNAKDNDKLTFTHGAGSDLWLHASGYAGSHVLIKAQNNKEIDEETILQAGRLALKNSKNRGKEGEIVITEQKYVKKTGGDAPGKVHIANYKRKFIKRDD